MSKKTRNQVVNASNVVSAAPQLQCLSDGSCNTSDFTLMPAKLYSRRNMTSPMTATEIEANFPSEYDIFRSTTNSVPASTNGVTSFQSNLIGGDEVPCDFLLCGVCVTIQTESTAFAVNGGEVSSVGGSAVTGDVPAYNGVAPLTVAADPNAAPFAATAEIGGNTIRAAMAFLQAYNLRFLLQCRYELFETALSDIGCVEGGNDVSMVGDSLTPADPWLRRLNEQYIAIGSTRRFLRPTAQGTAADGDLKTQQAFAPTTRAMYGGLKSKGAMHGFYQCPVPVLLTPCCRINMSFREVGESALSSGGDEPQLTRLKEELADTPVTPFWTGLTGATATGSAGTAMVRNFKYGELVIGVTMMGYEISKKACRDYFGQIPASMLDAYKGVSDLAPYLGK